MNLMILRVAWRNIWRNTRRTVITLVTMIICLGTMVWAVTLGDGAHEQMIRTSLTTGLGSFQIHAYGYQEDKEVNKAILDPDPVFEIAQQTPGIEGISVRLNSFGLMSQGNNSQGAAIIGIDPELEMNVSDFHEKIRLGDWFEEEISSGPVETGDLRRQVPIVIGVGMADKLDVDIGDRVFTTIQGFAGDAGYSNCKVVGIFASGMNEVDKNMVYMPINDLRFIMGAELLMLDDGVTPRFGNAVHEVTVLLEPHVDIDASVAQVQYDLENAGFNTLEVLSWEKIQPGLRQFIELDSNSLYIMMMFVYVIVAAGIMNTFLMAVYERIREFGILMSLGMRPISVFSLVVTESVLTGILGSILGLIAGLIAFWYNVQHPWAFTGGEEMNDIMNFDWSMELIPVLIWPNVLIAVVGILVVTMLAAIWPAIKASTLKPVEALRHV